MSIYLHIQIVPSGHSGFKKKDHIKLGESDQKHIYMYDIIQQFKENLYTKSVMVAQICNTSIQEA